MSSLIVDSKDLWDTVSTCHLPTDRSIRSDIALLRYYYETKKIDRMIWVPGSLNLAEPLTKWNSLLTRDLQLLLLTGELAIDLSGEKISSSNAQVG